MGSKYFYFFIKRLFDIFVSLVGIILLIPVIIIVKILNIINNDSGRIFYTHERIGKNGKSFKLYKFRTMVIDADKKLEELLKSNEELNKEYKINKKLSNDPRLTKTGKLLRKISIDEMPQFINILKGDMSFIGNRPYLVREKEDMGYYYDDIVKVKPGLTGYWQVNGRSNVDFNKRLELEQFYSNNYNIKLDIKIILQTIKVVLQRNGAV